MLSASKQMACMNYNSNETCTSNFTCMQNAQYWSECNSELRWDEMRWDEMRWDEMRWDEMRWDEKVCFVGVQLYNCMHASEVQIKSWWRTSSLLRSRNRPIDPWSVHHNSDPDTFGSCLSHPGLIYTHLQRIYTDLITPDWKTIDWILAGLKMAFGKGKPGRLLISHISNILY